MLSSFGNLEQPWRGKPSNAAMLVREFDIRWPDYLEWRRLDAQLPLTGRMRFAARRERSGWPTRFPLS